MEILDHFEKQPSNWPPPITWKTYAQQTGILFLAIMSIFIASALGLVNPFPLFESIGGWLLMGSTFLSTLFFYKKILKRPLVILVISLLGWITAGIGAISFVIEGLGWSRYNYLSVGLLIWLSYTLIEGLIFRLLHGWQQRRANS